MPENLIRNVLGCLTLFALSACGQPIEEIRVSTTPVDRPTLVLPSADRVITRPVEWIIVTPDNIEEVFANLRARNQSLALFAVTSTGYENISLNLNDIRTYIQQQQLIIVAYENYYQASSAAIDEANQQLSN
jgi:hypothetical protein